jgi:hypothetical protein
MACEAVVDEWRGAVRCRSRRSPKRSGWRARRSFELEVRGCEKQLPDRESSWMSTSWRANDSCCGRDAFHTHVGYDVHIAVRIDIGQRDPVPAGTEHVRCRLL